GRPLTRQRIALPPGVPSSVIEKKINKVTFKFKKKKKKKNFKKKKKKLLNTFSCKKKKKINFFFFFKKKKIFFFFFKKKKIFLKKKKKKKVSLNTMPLYLFKYIISHTMLNKKKNYLIFFINK
ncbi:hypothetical protein, partial [Bacillus anthracis]|uniref:hypothetical protein n=1 Tax=Bacillus anthracis TaxID=1392 RepID=UPI001A8DA846